jgi:NAD(P)-dependent dehydrogenase (short-subunit alcohol dehydrogenase family)
VNVASWGGLFPAPGMTMCSASKFAVVGFMHQLRWELAPKRVGVTLVIPGLVKSPILDRQESGWATCRPRSSCAERPAPRGSREVRPTVRADRGFITYGPDAFMVHVARHLPRWFLDLIGKCFARIMLRLVRNTKRAQSAVADGTATSASTQCPRVDRSLARTEHCWVVAAALRPTCGCEASRFRSLFEDASCVGIS